ncbi:BQ5605_C016g08130 [Microbotryum silenes-dioicae]|uniref:BQ5605_C016g08130 protein n=1 Tax=Microbotryum silenes-dioicae TaxID=796604 RepID=A0A2X0NYX7_9BASI|nr:BQ5605_C016g08130 [Microbotryum silenes-dioicae]
MQYTRAAPPAEASETTMTWIRRPRPRAELESAPLCKCSAGVRWQGRTSKFVGDANGDYWFKSR